MRMSQEETEKRFRHSWPGADDVLAPRVTDRVHDLADWIANCIPPGRHQSLALTALEDVRYRCMAALACDAVPPEKLA